MANIKHDTYTLTLTKDDGTGPIETLKLCFFPDTPRDEVRADFAKYLTPTCKCTADYGSSCSGETAKEHGDILKQIGDEYYAIEMGTGKTLKRHEVRSDKCDCKECRSHVKGSGFSGGAK